MLLGSKDASVASVMAALYAILSFLPGFPIIGLPSAQIKIADAISPLYGILLGPYVGALAAFVGALLGWVARGAGGGFEFFRIFCPPVAALSAGLLTKERVGLLRGNYASSALLSSLVVAWYLTPVGRTLWYFPFLHFCAIAASLAFRKLTGNLYLAGSACAFVGTMSQHMAGTLLFILCCHVGIIPLPTEALPLVFSMVLFLYPVERACITLVSAFFFVALFKSLSLTNFLPESFALLSTSKSGRKTR